MTVPEPTTGATGAACRNCGTGSLREPCACSPAAAVSSPEAAPTEGQAAADRAAVERVRALHFRRPWRATDPVHFGQTEFPDRCDHCFIGATWPCPTIRALDGAGTPDTDTQDGAGDTNKAPGRSECRRGERGRHNGSNTRPQWDNERGDQN